MSSSFSFSGGDQRLGLLAAEAMDLKERNFVIIKLFPNAFKKIKFYHVEHMKVYHLNGPAFLGGLLWSI